MSDTPETHEGEQFDDPNREAVGLPPIGAEPDPDAVPEPEPEPEPETTKKRGKAEDDDED